MTKTNDLEGAMDALKFYGRKLGRMGGVIKQKSEVIEFHVRFWDGTIYSAINPDHTCIHSNSTFFYMIDYPILSRLFFYIGLIGLIHRYQMVMYRFSYRRAIAKYPHLRNVLLGGADFPDELKDL